MQSFPNDERNGIVLGGRPCTLSKRLNRTLEKKQKKDEEKASRIAEAKRLAAMPWRPEMLDAFPRRERTLDQHTFVADLAPKQAKDLTGYLREAFAGDDRVVRALWRVAKLEPTSLRVKELFETVESYLQIAYEVGWIQNQAKKRAELEEGSSGSSGLAEGLCHDVEHIFDMACGHGLMGVLLAHRFPATRVVCVDLCRRPCLDHYVAAFQHADPDSLSRLEFVEAFIDHVEVPPNSFLTSVHACNEANKVAIEMAQRHSAGYAMVPCCIRDRLYACRVKRVDGPTRYATIVGVMAGHYGAHKVSAIDDRITDRYLMMFGGYIGEGMENNQDETSTEEQATTGHDRESVVSYKFGAGHAPRLDVARRANPSGSRHTWR